MSKKEEILKDLGKKDGLDDTRYFLATHYAALQDSDIYSTFKRLIFLENEGYITLDHFKHLNPDKS